MELLRVNHGEHTDDWSAPLGVENEITCPRGVIMRGVGNPRYTWRDGDDDNILESNLGKIEIWSQDNEPEITLNPSFGERKATGNYNNTYINGRDAYCTFIMNHAVDPGYVDSTNPLDRHGWDLSGNGEYWVKVNNVIVLDDNGNPIREPEDLIPTIVIKKVDP